MSEMTEARKAQMLAKLVADAAFLRGENLHTTAERIEFALAHIERLKEAALDHDCPSFAMCPRHATKEGANPQVCVYCEIERLEGEKRPMPAFDSPCLDGTMLCGVCDQSEARGHAPDCPGPDWPNRDIADLKAQLAARDKEVRQLTDAVYHMETNIPTIINDRDRLARKVARLKSQVLEQGAILEGVRHAIDGNDPSEFIESFPQVRGVLDLRDEVARLTGEHATLVNALADKTEEAARLTERVNADAQDRQTQTRKWMDERNCVIAAEAALATLRSEIDRVLHIADYDDHGRIGELEDMQRWRQRDRVALATLRGKVKEKAVEFYGYADDAKLAANAARKQNRDYEWRGLCAEQKAYTHAADTLDALGLPDTEAK